MLTGIKQLFLCGYRMIRPFILLVSILGRSLNVQLTCNRVIVCPGSVVTCECEAVGSLHWTVQPGSDCMKTLLPSSPIGVHEEICSDGHQAVLESSKTRDDPFSALTSSLNVTLLSENLTVTCRGTFGPKTVALGVESKCHYELAL